LIDFEPTEEQRLVLGVVAELARTLLVPRLRDHEAAGAVADDVCRAAHELGLGTMLLPEDAGGEGLGLGTAVLVEEELGRADAGAATGLCGPGAFGLAAAELAPDGERRRALLAPFAEGVRWGAVAWSEPAPVREREGFATTAARDADGWVLGGRKRFVANAGLADRYLVFAQIDAERGWRGIGAFVVAAEAPGLRVGERHDTLGLGAARFGEIVLDGVRVPDAARLEPAGDFAAAVTRFFAKHALLTAARAVGLAHAAFELARAYAAERQAFGKPIGHFQAVAFNLADRHMDVESARWLVWRAARAWDAGAPERTALELSALAAAHAHEAAMRTTDDCVSLHGGMGFMRDLVAEKMMRDAKQLALTGSTAEQLDQLATAARLGGALEPSLLWPSSDAQPVFL
jgi:alkylation response protein AidB-like acyl-CoA dehydrogenase